MARRQKPKQSEDGQEKPLAALESLITEAIQPGGRIYEGARRELTEDTGRSIPDAKPIKEALLMYSALRDAAAKDAETGPQQIEVRFGGSVPEEVAAAWAE